MVVNLPTLAQFPRLSGLLPQAWGVLFQVDGRPLHLFVYLGRSFKTARSSCPPMIVVI